MAFLDDLQRLSDLRASGDLTDAEFSAAKQRLLASEQPTVKTRDAASERLLLEAELARIDREFEQERRQCLSTGQHGERFEPSVMPRVILPLIAMLILGVFGSQIVGVPIVSSGSPFGGSNFIPGCIVAVFMIVLAIAFITNEINLGRLDKAKQRRDTAKSHAIRRMNELRRHS